MRTAIIVSVLLLLMGTFVSCTVEKRLFNKGYHVEWNRKFKRSAESFGQSDQRELEDSDPVEELPEHMDENTEFTKDTIDPINAGAAADSHMDVQSDEFSDVQEVKKESSLEKTVYRKKNHFKMYNRGNGGNVLLGLCTLVMICICMAMINALFFGELSFGAIILILCFGWILVVFTIILIVLFIVRFIRNF